jgi:hypothetical protein
MREEREVQITTKKNVHEKSDESKRGKGWLVGAWIWIVPLVLVSVIVSSALCCSGLVVGFYGTIKSTEIYQDTLYVAQSNPQVIHALGEPIKPSFFVAGSIDVLGAFVTAELEIPVSGPRGSGTVYAISRLTAGDWNYILLQMVVDETGERIDLLSRQ